MLSIVHDLAEAQVGDITPHEGFTKAQKRQLEQVPPNLLKKAVVLNSSAGCNGKYLH
jgi:5'-deoxynucleotidase YfbR-like HD superfamily hydrolase